MTKGKVEKILVIDDSLENLYTIKEILEEEGFTVITASEGSSGIKTAASENISLIICDIMMPEMNGFEVLEKLRNNSITAAIPFVFLSAKSDLKDIRHALMLGADDFIPKPINRREIISTINMRLSRKGLFEKKLNELRQSISYALPHELKTPMVSILGFSQVIKNDAGTLSAGEVSEMADIIYKSAYRLNNLVQKILFYTKLDMLQYDEAQMQLFTDGFSEVTTEAISEMIISVLEQYNRKRDVKLTIEPAEIVISLPNLKTVIEEITENACKFSKPGSELTITGTPGNSEYFFYILDNGRGMSEEQIASLGGYQQINRNLYEQQGVGLGLTIAKKIAELHSGSFTVESIPGKKTLVSISFPLKKE